MKKQAMIKHKTTRLPQYMKSTDQEVLEAVRENVKLQAEFFDGIKAYEEELGNGIRVYYFSEYDGLHFAGLSEKPEGRGEWTKVRGRYHPYRSNLEERRVIGALRRTWADVPGVKPNVSSDTDRNGKSFRMFPKPFEFDGAAWVGYPHPPERGSGPADSRWEEVLGSEYMSAQDSQ